MRWIAAVYFRNVHDKMADGKTAFDKMCRQKFDGPSVLFGTLVEYIPITEKEKSRVRQFGKKIVKGIFFGCVLRAGGGWSVDLMTAVNGNLQASEASETYVTRFK